MRDPRPLVALTMGDAAGIGPEVIARAWSDPRLHDLARPVVVGDAGVMEQAVESLGSGLPVLPIGRSAACFSAYLAAWESAETPRSVVERIGCWSPSEVDLSHVIPGRVDGHAGRAAYDYLVAAIDVALSGQIDAIVTLPLNKEALRLGGIEHPGHTEILAERCWAPAHAMMLYLAPPPGSAGTGLGVVHATLHVPLRQVFDLLTTERVSEAIALADSGMRPLTGGRPPRVAVAGLNPHAGENGLFGDEERHIIAPAVSRVRSDGIGVVGPIAADTLFARALAGEFDAVVAMYHDQGHVAIKTVGFDRAVNVTLGLPIVRTSVAHGTAFDIAGQGQAETSSLIEAVRVAARLVAGRGGEASGGRPLRS